MNTSQHTKTSVRIALRHQGSIEPFVLFFYTYTSVMLIVCLKNLNFQAEDILFEGASL